MGAHPNDSMTNESNRNPAGQVKRGVQQEMRSVTSSGSGGGGGGGRGSVSGSVNVGGSGDSGGGNSSGQSSAMRSAAASNKGSNNGKLDGPNNLSVWFCSSRWLLAHHDSFADINTSSAHLVLADLHQDNDHSLALIDFKHYSADVGLGATENKLIRPPYDCRLRVYRGKHLVYSHFLNDVPSALVMTSCRSQVTSSSSNKAPFSGAIGSYNNNIPSASSPLPVKVTMEPNLLITINDDVYFYNRLKASQKISLQDDPRIIGSLNKLEIEAWQAARQDPQVDTSSLRELLLGLRNAVGAKELSSHSNNFLALVTQEERKNYLLAWRLKRVDSQGPQIMSMDTICCASSRRAYPFNSNWTSSVAANERGASSGPRMALAGQEMDQLEQGLVLGTEDRHLLIYNVVVRPPVLGRHYRLPATPDHILIESRSPKSYTLYGRQESYAILVSCRNCIIYRVLVSGADNEQEGTTKDKQPGREDKSMKTTTLGATETDQRAQSSSGIDGDNAIRQLVGLKSPVVQMIWADGELETNSKGDSRHPNFVVATLDRRLYCLGSYTGDCKWMINVEAPITSIVSLPPANIAGLDMNLIGVASQANRVDFYTSSAGLIVDSIFFNSDHIQSMVFGRFGREDNCLVLITRRGQMLIFILKRGAKFAHGQCLSSANAYATEALSRLKRELKANGSSSGDLNLSMMTTTNTISRNLTNQQGVINTKDETSTAMKQSVRGSTSGQEETSNLSNKSDHECERVNLESSSSRSQQLASAVGSGKSGLNPGMNPNEAGLEAALLGPRMSLPVKSRHFVDHIVQQRAHGKASGRVFARQLLKMSQKLTSNLAHKESQDDGNRLNIVEVLGLGNTYRVTLSLCLQAKMILDLCSSSLFTTADPHHQLGLMLFLAKGQRPCRLSPIRFDLTRDLVQFLAKQNSSNFGVNESKFNSTEPMEVDEILDKQRSSSERPLTSHLEKTIEFRLDLKTSSLNSMGTLLSQQQLESISLDVMDPDATESGLKLEFRLM